MTSNETVHRFIAVTAGMVCNNVVYDHTLTPNWGFCYLKNTCMNTTIPNVHVLKVHYIPQTNDKPARIKIFSERFRHGVTFSWDGDFGKDTCEQAEHWLQKKGFNIIGHAIPPDFYYIITDTFQPLKQPKQKPGK